MKRKVKEFKINSILNFRTINNKLFIYLDRLNKMPFFVNKADDKALSEQVGHRLEDIVLQLMNDQQIITIGLSGGSLIDLLASIVPRLQLPRTRLRFFFVDERFVPFTSNESIYGNYQTKLFRQLPITEENIIKIDSNLKSVEECAQDYQIKLQELLIEQDKVNIQF
jgi:6-phosphogluconolactonase/glucosamine-6-phosphate isomerase/deaminase